MKLVLWLAGISWISWLPTTVLSDRQTSLEILYGMIGPLAAVCATWIVADRTYRHRPEALTAVMIMGFAGKLVFFLVYVTVMIRVLSLRPVPFVASFTTYFIVLYFIAALHLRRLFWGGMRS
jgi:hypothetical protein